MAEDTLPKSCRRRWFPPLAILLPRKLRVTYGGDRTHERALGHMKIDEARSYNLNEGPSNNHIVHICRYVRVCVCVHMHIHMYIVYALCECVCAEVGCLKV